MRDGVPGKFARSVLSGIPRARRGRELRRLAALVLVAAALPLAGCTTSVRKTLPEQSATEQLLISAATDRAIDQLDLRISPGTRVFVSASYFEARDEAYALGAIRDRVLREGGRLVESRSDADVILEIRAAALSIDEGNVFVGIPSISLPIPLTPAWQTPEIALFKREHQEGIAKLAVTSYWVESGRLNSSSGPVLGKSTRNRWGILFISWTTMDPPVP